jgi:tetratricopeptide (TPR) repeat protein
VALGFLHAAAGDYPTATACYQQGLELSRGAGDQVGQVDALVGLGLVQHDTGDYRAAAASHRQALEVYRDLGDQYGQLMTLLFL